MSRIGLIAREGSADAGDARRDAAAWLEARGQEVVALDRGASPTGLDLVIAFGGDGTLLGAAHAIAAAAADVPVLGINLGHLGFLTEVSRAEMFEALEAVLAGRTRIETRLMLHGAVTRQGQHLETAAGGSALGTVVAERVALNDIVVTRGALSRMIEVQVEIDGQAVTTIRADGVIVATPTGSTAYNLSAGGPILMPSLGAITLTPIAPHALGQRPVVLPATALIVLRPTITAQSDIVATFDGQFGVELSAGSAVVIRRAPAALQLVRVTTRTHFDMLRDKLRWGQS